MHWQHQEVQSTWTLTTNLELPGQGKIELDQWEQVGDHIVSNEEVIPEFNGITATYQRWHFPIMCDKGNQYIMVLYNYNYNAILATGYKSCSWPDLINAYDEIYNQWIKAGIVSVI